MFVTVQQLTSELQSREGQFNNVQDRGEALVMDRHPASNIIRVGHLALYKILTAYAKARKPVHSALVTCI